MNIYKAKSAGFCFGVNRAVTLTYKLLDEGHKVAILGPLIHNAQCVADLTNKGAVTVNNINEIPQDYEVIIRSHGVPSSIYDELSKGNFVVHDATCPFVKKIQ
ncbi:MAG: bifunctional 4-hydroxy-3-methylbut-2-enyl diphosphate reductase/30S ribosomal protein S1, partial [Oscillospiraceae bacterium]